MYSARLVFLASVLLNILPTLLTPLASALDHRVLAALRLVAGCGGGCTFPALNVMITAWSPPHERSLLASICFGGASLGTIIATLSSGQIKEDEASHITIILGLLISYCGWEAVFYVHGSLSCIWCLLWLGLVSDAPQMHRFISEEERKMIIESQHTSHCSNNGPIPVPWRAMFTSPPFLTLSLTHLCNNFGWYMLLVELPLFARTGLGVDMEVITLMSSLPFLANWVWSLVYSRILDHLRSQGSLSTLAARRLSVLVSSVLPGLCLLLIIIIGDNILGVVLLTTLAVMFYGSMFSGIINNNDTCSVIVIDVGVFSNHGDLAPNLAGTLMAVTNMVATLPGVLIPPVVGLMTQDTPGLGPWHSVFGFTIGVLILEVIIFFSFARSDVQPWNSPES